MKILHFLILILFAVLFLGSSRVGLNKSYKINNGETISGSTSTVNGRITVGENANVNGECRTVNGNIDVGAHSKVRDLATVNGNVSVGRDTLVKGDIELVNGRVHCEPDVKVTGCVGVVNGKISLKKTLIEKDLSTYNGNIELSDNTIIGGDIIIKEKHGTFTGYRKLKIEIDNSSVEGDIINEDPDYDVVVYLTNGGKVKGKIIDAKVVEK